MKFRRDQQRKGKKKKSNSRAIKQDSNTNESIIDIEKENSLFSSCNFSTKEWEINVQFPYQTREGGRAIGMGRFFYIEQKKLRRSLPPISTARCDPSSADGCGDAISIAVCDSSTPSLSLSSTPSVLSLSLSLDTHVYIVMKVYHCTDLCDLTTLLRPSKINGNWST